MLRMKEKIEVPHKGVTIVITPCKSVKKGVVYKSYQIADYSTGRRKRWTFADLDKAKKKAKELAESKGTGESTLSALAPLEQAIQAALEALTPTATRIDRAAYIFADACQIVEPAEIVTACRYWRDHRPDKKLRRVTVSDGIKEFLAHHRASAVRKQNLKNFLDLFAREFGDTAVSSIHQIQIEKWFAGRDWASKTVNGCLQMASQFWKYAIKNGWAVKNPVAEIPRLKVPRGPVAIYTPEAFRKQLYNLHRNAPELAAAAAVGAFGGLRISEIARLDWTQLNQALQTGFLELSGTLTKTGELRYVPVSQNLKAWLMTYLQESGPVIPRRWLESTKRHLNRLSELGRHIARKTNTDWQKNGWRHSFGTYHFKLHGDPHATITAMGTSLEKLNRHYMSKAQIVSKELATEWFAIMPPTEENVVQMPQSESPSSTIVTGAAVGASARQ
jgi:integrase